nr:retrovirus-related Pol polyprotein from transposon TNT 1-94 [Tanacetum cinerariifolium]
MLDRTYFASWQQRIRLYCRGKDNRVNILKSIDEGPYKLGKFRETLAESTEGTPQFGLERPHVYSDLNSNKQDRYNVDIRATNILLQGLPKDIYTLINHYTDAKDIWDNVKMLLEGSELTKEDRESQLYDDFEHFRPHKEELINDYYVRFSKLINDMRNIKMTLPKLQLNSKFVNNMLPEWGRFVTVVKLNRGYGEAQNRVGNVNQGHARPGQARTVKCYNCNGTGHIAQNCTQPKRPQNSEYFKDKMLLMQAQENEVALDAEQLLFLAGGPDNAFDDDVNEQPVQDLALNVDNVFQAKDYDAFDSDVRDHDQYLDDTCAYQEEHVMHDSYVKYIDVSVVHSNASSVSNDTFMMIYDDMCEPITPYVSNSSRNAVVKNSLTAELATYREQVKLYERRAKFELTEREQKINEQLRLVISDRNFKEETLKRELHSTKLQLTSTINRNKSMVEETTFLKQDFKQKENKLLADFLNMKSLKEKAQPALYNGHEILKDNHARTKVHNTEDTLEIAKITRKKMNAKMTDPECVTHKVKIAPHDYSKENLFATFTPQKQLTPEQIYWSNDLMKLKSEGLKERANVSRPMKTFTVYPPNTPATLVPRVLPTTSQVKIH